MKGLLILLLMGSILLSGCVDNNGFYNPLTKEEKPSIGEPEYTKYLATYRENLYKTSDVFLYYKTADGLEEIWVADYNTGIIDSIGVDEFSIENGVPKISIKVKTNSELKPLDKENGNIKITVYNKLNTINEVR